MRILYFYQYFSTSGGSWGTRVHDFASEWVKRGHEVTVVTSIYSKSDLTATRFAESKIIDGIHIKVLNILIDNKQSFLKRIWSFIQYAIVSSWYAITLPADVVIASSGPITVGLPGLAARYIRKRKLVFEVRDLWPDGAIELGIIRNPIVKFIAHWFEKRCYRAAGLIITLSPGIEKHIKQKYLHPNVFTITNTANIELFSKSHSFPEQYNFIKPFKYAIYTGNIGAVNHSLWVYDIACALKHNGRSDIIILMIGDGQQKAELKFKAKAHNIENFIVLDLIPKRTLVPILQYALASLVPLKPSRVLNTSSPNKFFEALAAGVPVIQTTDGWLKEFIADHQVGYTVSPLLPDEAIVKLLELDRNPILREELKNRSLAASAKWFDKNELANMMLKQIELLAKNKQHLQSYI